MLLEFIVNAAFVTILASIAVIDFRSQRIPNGLNALLFSTGLTWAAFGTSITLSEALLGALIGGGGFYLLRFLYFKIRHIEGIGLGDIKFLAAAGTWVGITGLPVLLLVASFTGLLYGLVILRNSENRAQSRIAFGPFLAFGLIVSYFVPAI